MKNKEKYDSKEEEKAKLKKKKKKSMAASDFSRRCGSYKI